MIRILIADDEPKIRRGLRGMIVELNPEYTVVAEAEDGEQAIQQVRSTNPDILLVDICMPFLNGLEFIEQLRKEQNDDVKIIVISGYDDFEYARRSIALGVFDYLLKPVEEEALKSVLERAVLELESNRREKSYLSWVRSQLDKEMDTLVARFFRDWCEGRLSTEEQHEYLEFYGLSLPEKAGLIVAMAMIPETEAHKMGALQVLGEHLMAQRNLEKLTYTLIQEFDPIVSFTDEKGRIGVITRRYSGETWAELCTELEGKALKTIGYPIRVHQSCVHLTAEALHESWEEVCETLSQGDVSGTLAENLRTFIETNYFNSRLTVEDLSREFKISPGYVTRLLKQATGYGFSDFLNRVRIRRSIELMRDSTMRFGDVAELVGYTSQHYFNRAFKRVMGMAPGEFRNGVK